MAVMIERCERTIAHSFVLPPLSPAFFFWILIGSAKKHRRIHLVIEELSSSPFLSFTPFVVLHKAYDETATKRNGTIHVSLGCNQKDDPHRKGYFLWIYRQLIRDEGANATSITLDSRVGGSLVDRRSKIRSLVSKSLFASPSIRSHPRRSVVARDATSVFAS